ELAADRDLLTSIPFFSGYAVETGMLIDVLAAVGLDAMAQVDLGIRTNRSQRLFDLSRMSYELVLAIERRALPSNGSLRRSRTTRKATFRCARSARSRRATAPGSKWLSSRAGARRRSTRTPA